MMPLGLLESGEQAEIAEIKDKKTGRYGCSGEQARIEDMGIRPGKSVEMLTNKGLGPILLKVGESRIAMGRGMAMKIMVRRER